MSRVSVGKILDFKSRDQALEIIKTVFGQEKNWLKDSAGQIPKDLVHQTQCSWFMARVNGRPAGLLRLIYDPPLEMPKECVVTLKEGVSLDALSRGNRFVEIGRFMILPEYRRNVRVSLRLMQMAFKEVVERDYSHFITDVFENEPNSPLNFHTRVLGFEIIGTHLYGDLNCSCTRIILTLDILKAFRALRLRRHRVFMSITRGVRGLLNKKVSAAKL